MKLIPLVYNSIPGWEETIYINPHQVTAIDEYTSWDTEGEPFINFRIHGPNNRVLAEGVGTARAAAEALKFMIDTKREIS